MNEVSLENCNTATLQQREQSDACIDSAERLQPRQSQQLQQRCKTVEVNVLFVNLTDFYEYSLISAEKMRFNANNWKTFRIFAP